MKKIGFIDYFLDEWHANNYPAWINAEGGGEYTVAYAYGKAACPRSGMTSAQWCEKYGIECCQSIEELVDKSDCIVVLSPDDPQFHEELSQTALRSGKPTFIDKTFSVDGAAARRIFALANENGTACFTSSALRYATEYTALDRSAINGISSWGPGEIVNYSVHQLEPVCMLMGTKAKRVLYTPGKDYFTLLIEFEDGRFANTNHYRADSPFMMNLAMSDENRVVKAESDYFRIFIRDLLAFFDNGIPPVAAAESIAVMDLREAAINASQQPGTWVDVRH